ncbi:MAG TPA: DNA mismatch repair endonuclease MutL [Flavobacteriales bacterium]|nr:DNA mismatch repair endonuclease MutL [Flavobacteriales bacterium]HMW96409.1 DNA mismatch repair endonuclease MutL [Flavobacteriales bacterium]HNE81635.1 DNA mismatch repair endonuclease MutL [Flavobacteriales bacterium]HNM68771.1 DNA mismatch repair endonuclease MutL [Flavobacteriales bacterium]
MSDIIRLLPDHVANQIAAGEVVQRPASAVKELLENSVDAGATDITLVLKDAGRTLIQVTDNGQGMSPTDARLSFERHATSKIRSADDLSAVRTKGFRGEALASIAAVAQVELKTRRPEDELGTRILIEGSRVKSQETVACATGSVLRVRSLFYNVPARRQFLKSDPIELKHAIEEFHRVALAHPDIAFDLFHNDQEVHRLPVANLRQRITHLFGRKYDERLVPVSEATGIVGVEGFICKPEFARRTRGEQYFFVNGRYIRSGYLEHAVRRAYDELVQRDHHPGWFLLLHIDPAFIDINIHPTKTEIKFRDDRAVYAILHAAARRALGRHSITPSLDFEPEPALLAMSGVDTAPVPATGNAGANWRPRDLPRQTIPAGWQRLFDLPDDAPQRSGADPEASPTDTVGGQHVLPMRETMDLGARPVFQLHGRYILAQLRSGFVVIDQRRAQERIVYERSMRSLEKGQGPSQAQLFPVSIGLNAADHALLMGILPELGALGFRLEPLSGRSFAVNGLPAESGDGDPQQLVEQLLEQVKNESGALRSERHATIARGMARSMVRNEGRQWSATEMHDLIDRLFACGMPYTTPGGKPVLITWSLQELDERFDR